MTDTMIKRAEAAKLISQPSFANMPAAAPLVVAFRTIELRNGTEEPPGALARRISFGSGPSTEVAARLAGFEAIERYALQYTTDMADTCQSLLSSDGNVHALSRRVLSLGAPGLSGLVTSRGSAAGADGDSAAIRALMECIEGSIDDSDAYSHILPEKALPKNMRDWLSRYLRRVELSLAPIAGIGLAVRAICSDLDGGRPTYGSAFSSVAAQAIWRASCEAVVSWRNMVALDFNAVTEEQMDAHEKRLFHLYRGAEKRTSQSPLDIYCLESWETPRPTLSALLATTEELLGAPVALFDMTAPELPMPVIKAVKIS